MQSWSRMANILAVQFLRPTSSSRNFLKVGPSIFILVEAKSTSSLDYQYLERSKVPTLKFQKSLLRLPVPKLEQTIERYVTALEPIIPSEEQYQKTVKIANSFRDGEGKRLHEKLLEHNKNNKHTSYISKPWFDMYLSSRVPLVLNFNPFMSWKNDPDPQFMKLPIRVTNMMISALRFKRSLEEEVLSPEVFHLNPAKSDTDFYRTLMSLTPEAVASYLSMALKAFPLDMSQFASLFNGTRIPLKGKDVLKKYPDSKHVVFLKAGQFYSIDVLDSEGNIRPPEEILSLVQSILDVKVDSEADSITSLSAENRDTWAEARDRLIASSSQNQKSLEILDSAIFTIAIDDLEFDDQTELLDAAHNYLHGNSRKQGNKPLNRWFDKSFGFLFDQAGHASITFEHSWGDGVAVLRVFNDIFKDSTKNHFVGPETKSSEAKNQVKHLSFVLSPESKKDVDTATKNWKKFTSTLDLNYALYDKLSRDYFKKKKVSPDSMFQLAFQMAFFKVYKTTVPTYESCSTSAFKHGRTEVVRAATMETKRACEAFSEGNKTSQELRQHLDACSKKHFQLTKDAAMGQGFDRHLFALRLISEAEGKKQDIFTDPSYTQANHFVLSTSSLFGNYFSGGGFAPVVDDGFGLGYGYVDDSLGILCSSFKGKRDGNAMTQAFVQALDQIKRVLEET